MNAFLLDVYLGWNYWVKGYAYPKGSFGRCCWTFFKRGFANLCSTQPLGLSVFFIPATQVGASGICLMVLSAFLITKEVETHFHMVIGHLYIIFCEVLVQVFCPYFCWVLFVFSKLIYRSYIYIVWIWVPLLRIHFIYFYEVFSHTVDCFSNLSILSLEEQKFFLLIESNWFKFLGNVLWLSESSFYLPGWLPSFLLSHSVSHVLCGVLGEIKRWFSRKTQLFRSKLFTLKPLFPWKRCLRIAGSHAQVPSNAWKVPWYLFQESRLVLWRDLPSVT